MEWMHTVKREWLEARRSVITATECISLISTYNKLTKKQKAGTELNPAFAALWGKKNSVEELDPVSYGPAARGHIMEPYAVEEFNVHSVTMEMFHWDDAIICNNGLGFSPDALDIKQFEPDVYKFNIIQGKLVGEGSGVTYPKPEKVLEIKSYGAENHMKSINTRLTGLKERYQLAVAMAVCPSIEYGYLMFYNPACPIGWDIKVTKRSELEDEIELILGVSDVWNKTCILMNNEQRRPCLYTEEKIHEIEMPEHSTLSL
jgi:hypothetical protein